MKLVNTILWLLFIGAACYPQNSNYNFNEVDNIIKKAIEDSSFPGAVVLISKDGAILHHKAFGNYTYNKSLPQVDVNSIFDLASVTKIAATTTAAMICIDRNLFSLDDSVSKYIPEFEINDKCNISVKNLLLHNSGLPSWKRYYDKSYNPEDILKDIYSLKKEYRTGTKTVYSDLGIIILGKIIEKVTGKSLDKFCKNEIFTPLEMNSTMFNPPSSIKGKVVPTEYDNYWRNRLLQGEVHDELSSLLNGVAGHAGLFATAEDISKLLQMILQKGNYKGNQIIKSETVELFTRKYSDLSTRGLGWDTKSPLGSSAGSLFSEKSFGHTGFTGTSVWVDAEKNLFVIFLTNRVYPTRNNTKIIKVRPALHDAVVKAVGN